MTPRNHVTIELAVPTNTVPNAMEWTMVTKPQSMVKPVMLLVQDMNFKIMKPETDLNAMTKLQMVTVVFPNARNVLKSLFFQKMSEFSVIFVKILIFYECVLNH